MRRIIKSPVIWSALAGPLLAAVAFTAFRPSSDADPSLQAFGQSAGINEVKHFTTLDELPSNSDLIVTGRVKEIRDGRVFGRTGLDQVAYVVAEVEVDQWLSGDVQSPTVLVEFFAGPVGQRAYLKEALKGVAGTWFLTNKHSEAIRLGLTGELVSREAGLYMLVSSQGLILDDGGNASTPLAEDEDSPVHRATNNREYADFLAEVRALAK